MFCTIRGFLICFILTGERGTALCYLKRVEIESARRDILYAMDGIKDFSNNIDKQFIRKGYDRIFGQSE